MKLHLPSALRRALLSVLAAATLAAPAWAEIMHNSATLLTYTDFGSNMGRYSIYQQNALLQYLNSAEQGGVRISFTQGEPDYVMVNGMISYESMVDGGPFTAIAHNATATVQHNGVPNPVFTGRFIGTGNSIHYAGIEYRSCTENKFLLTPEIDYKITRLSKVITDITPTSVYDTAAHLKAGEDVGSMLQYRAGGGYMQVADENGNTKWLAGAYAYVTGGIVQNTSFSYNNDFSYSDGTGSKTDGRGITDDSYTIGMTGVMNGNGWGPGTASTDSHPLPFVTQGGDSGSPVWVWNQDAGAYELISCHQARGGNNSYSRGASEWTKETLASFDKKVDMDQAEHEVHIGKVQITDKSKTIAATANDTTPVETTLKYGKVSSANGAVNLDFVGIENGTNTWLNLYDKKDVQNWYAYGNEYLNTTNNEGGKLQYADLFETQNLVFQSAAGETSIILDADVDLGIGYAQFTNTAQSGIAKFTISGKEQVEGRDYNFNHAGYIVDANTEVHLALANQERAQITITTGEGDEAVTRVEEGYYFREWRKTGEGDLYLEGCGDNNIFLNVGGKGTTYLQEKAGGYAAYNVLINNCATVNLGGDKEQVKRDVTFGYGGGVLDFAGNVEMEWYTEAEAAADAFTINALTQDAIIANTAEGTTTKLTYKEGGKTTYLGSFQDTSNSTLQVTFAGGSDAEWTLNSIHTKLLNKDSGLEVKNGKVILAGTNTEHGQGSLTGFNTQSYSNADDWHYADAQMNVTVDSGATFELGSHARLTGTVTVNGGGTFLMNEGVRHQMEYIEGWYFLEDTYKIAEYYGLHGDVNLEGADSKMVVQYSEGTDANTTLTGKITGSGSMTVDTAKGSLTLKGENTFSGGKTLSCGTLALEGTAAAGNTTTNRWKLDDQGILVVNRAGAHDALALVKEDSSGVLALTQNEEGPAINVSGHKNLIIGAKAGETIQFGLKDTEEQYAAVDGKWNLGGGGGNLVVNYALTDNNTLVLGNEYTTGVVTLTNSANKIGQIDFAGKVTLVYDSVESLGGATVNLEYTNRIMGVDGTVQLIGQESDGVMLLDKMDDTGNIDVSSHLNLRLGVSKDTIYTGTFTLGEDYDEAWDVDFSSYNFGGSTATLTLTLALTDQNTLPTDLYMDAEGYSGGVLNLEKALEITGNVYIMGNRSLDPEQGGDFTLRLNENDSLGTVAVYLYRGGCLDINGTAQTLNSISADEGSSIIDSSKGKEGTLLIHSTLNGSVWGNSLGGTVDVGTLVTEGDVQLMLSGKLSYNDMIIREAGVFVSADDVFCETGITHVEDATLELGTYKATTIVELADAVLKLGDELEPRKQGELAGVIYTAKDTKSNTINFSWSNAVIYSVIDVDKTSELSIEGNTARLASGLIAESGGTVHAKTGQMELTNSEGTYIGGTLDIQGVNGKMTLLSGGGSDNILREIDHLQVDEGTELSLRESSWNTIWNIHSLSGEGDIVWDSQKTHWYSSRVVLDGENDYSGTFTAKRTGQDTGETPRSYAAYLELAHDGALRNAAVDLQGAGENGYMTMAVNTENASIRGLNGNTHTALYAGAAVEGGDRTASQLAHAPVSTRQATLTITGEDNYTFSGNVCGGAEDTRDGLDIVMAGSGTQIFNGEKIAVNSVTAKQGRLELDSAGLEIKERATIYRGAALQAGSALELKSGMTLMVAGSGENQATLGSTLKLGGGSIGFDGNSINATSAALSVSHVEKGTETSLNVLFESTSAVRQNTEYKLAGGTGWTTIGNGAYHALGLDYYDANFTANNEGLSVTFSLKDSNTIWMGTNSQSTWNNSNFGPDREVPGEGKTAVFNDLAQSKAVQVQGNQESAKLLFDSTQEYTVAGQAGGTLAAEGLQQTGSGTTSLGSGVSISGAADVQAGTLVLKDGSTAGSATVAEDATLRLESAGAVFGTVEGSGTLEVAWVEGQTGSLSLGGAGIGSVAVQSGTLDVSASRAPEGSISALSVAEHGTVVLGSLNSLAEGTTARVDGTLSIALDNGRKNIVAVDAESKGTVELRSGSISYLSQLGEATLALDSGSTLLFGDGDGNRTASFGNDVELRGNATLKAFGSNYYDSATLTGSVSGEYTLTKTDVNEHVAISGRVDLAGVNVEQGKLLLDGDAESRNTVKTVQVTGNATAQLKNTDTRLINLADAAQITAVKGAEEFFSLNEQVDMKAGGTQATISGTGDTRIENALIDLKAGSRVEMADITLAASSRITDAAATLVAKGMKVEAQVGSNLTRGADMVLSSGLQMLTFGGTHTACTAEQGSRVAQFTLGNIEDVTIEGSSLVITLVGLGGTALDDCNWVSVELTGGAVFSETLAIRLEYTDAEDQVKQLTGYYSAVDQGQDAATAVHNLVYFNLAEEQVPEPASSTLSLLALAALAARRRRKR